jgi:streptomycin 6-kinase
MYGDRGQIWLDGLHELIAKLEQNWALQVFEAFPAGEFNFVAPAIRNNGEHVVIKIAPPFENREARSEAKYLRMLGGAGVIKLLAEDRGHDAILLERAIPGRNLAEIFAGNEPACATPAIDVLKRILRPVPADLTDVLSLDDWFRGLRRYGSTNFPHDYARKALDLYDNMLRGQPNYYLHGDFHPANIVSAEREAYLAIDPKGMVGPIGYDIAVFLNNYHWWQESRVDVRQRLNVAVGAFAEAFDLSSMVLRQWAFAQMVLSAWWTFDEMPQLYNNEVAKADIWDV